MEDLFKENQGKTLDEYIEALQALRASHPEAGKLQVQKWSSARGRHDAPAPKIAYKKIKPVAGTAVEIKQFYQEGYDRPDEKGDPVIRI